MNPVGSAVSSALDGLRKAVERVNRDAGVIASSGLDVAPAPAPPVDPAGRVPVYPQPSSTPDFDAAMVHLIVAQRAFTAQRRTLETAEAMAGEAIRLGDHRSSGG